MFPLKNWDSPPTSVGKIPQLGFRNLDFPQFSGIGTLLD
jgi:hypothetical protein